MEKCSWAKVIVLTLALTLGLTLVSGQLGQAYAAPSHTGGSWSHTGDPGHWHSGGYTGGNYYGGWYNGGWFWPAYPYYQCPPGYAYNPNVYNPSVYPPYCQLITP